MSLVISYHNLPSDQIDFTYLNITKTYELFNLAICQTCDMDIQATSLMVSYSQFDKETVELISKIWGHAMMACPFLALRN